MIVSVRGKLFNRVLPVQIVCQFWHALKRIELLSVLVRISKGKLENQSAHARLFIIGCHVDGVFRNEDVGSDATTAEHFTSDTCMIGRSRMLNAVLREEFAVLISADQILFVVQWVT